jgi:hypothetical protein
MKNERKRVFQEPVRARDYDHPQKVEEEDRVKMKHGPRG